MSSQLPAELWLQIASYLSRPWLGRLARSNRTIYSILLHNLHHHLFFQGDARSDDKICQTLTRISTDPDLSRAVQSCTLQSIRSSTLDFAFLCFKLFPNLADITLEYTLIHENQLDQLLISVDKHPFSLTLFSGEIKTCNTRNVSTPLVYDTHGPLPRFTSLSIVDNIVSFTVLPLFIHWTSTHTLEHLTLCGRGDFIASFLTGRLKPVPFPKLKTLRLSAFSNNDVGLFALMPMLEGLYFVTNNMHGTIYSDTLAIPKKSLPRLCHFEGIAEYVMPVVCGRPIRRVALSKPVPSHIHHSIALNFGSLTPIRCLTLNDMPSPLSALKFAVSCCPALHELTISQTTRYTTAPHVFVRDHIEHLRRLTELRKLLYTSLEYSESWTALSWERRVCEVLERTAPAIRTVRLSLKGWHKSDIDGSWYYPLLKSVVDRTPEFVPSLRWPDPGL